MNHVEMVVLIVAIWGAVSIVRAKYGVTRSSRRRDREEAMPAYDPDAGRMRDELRALKERVAVLERIVTDKSSALDREIEALRDR